MGKWTRRAFIGAGALAGGGFVLGVTGATFAPSRHSVRSDDAEATGELNTWILVTPDNIVTVLVPHCEMGQGAQTALAMMAAEEMDADWSLVRIKEAPALDGYANAYIGRAFLSVPGPLERGFDYGTYRARPPRGPADHRRIAVGAQHRPLRHARRRSRRARNARCRCRQAVRRARVGVHGRQLARDARGVRQIGDVRRARESRGEGIGPVASGAEGSRRIHAAPHRAARGCDMRSKVDGSAIYGIDFTIAGMLHAAVEIAPVFGGKLVSVDTAAAEKMPGVKRVVKLEEAVAVVADTYWQARKALATLKPQFDDAGHGAVTSATIFDAFDKALGAAPDMPAGATVVKADYRVPFLPHATMEPMACTVRVTGDRAEVWAGTQDPLNSRSTAAKALDISAAARAVHEPGARRRLRHGSSPGITTSST